MADKTGDGGAKARNLVADTGVEMPCVTTRGADTETEPPTTVVLATAVVDAEYARVTRCTGEGDRWTKTAEAEDIIDAPPTGSVRECGCDAAGPKVVPGDNRLCVVTTRTSSAPRAWSSCVAPGRMILHGDILIVGDVARWPRTGAMPAGTWALPIDSTHPPPSGDGAGGATRRSASRHCKQLLSRLLGPAAALDADAPAASDRCPGVDGAAFGTVARGGGAGASAGSSRSSNPRWIRTAPAAYFSTSS